MSAKQIHKLLITGSTGLVGSKFVNVLKDKFSILTIGRSNVDSIVNLTSRDEVFEKVSSSDAEAIINFAAYTNVDGAEKEKNNKNGEVYILNVMLPLWLAEACKNTGKNLYHISTDYVFDGKSENRPYTEESIPSPINSWYSQTKYFGEENILNLDGRFSFSSIVRISYPYSGLYKRKLDIARAVIERTKNGQEYFGISDQKIKPTSVDDITQGLLFLIQKHARGIYHIAGNFAPKEYITPYEFACVIAETFNLNKGLIKPISFEEFQKKRIAPRPQHTWLDTTKIEGMGFNITNLKDSLNRFKQQLINH